MNSRERILAAVQRKEVDYIPCSPFFNPLTPQQRIGYHWQFPFGSSEQEKAQYCTKELGLDPVVAIPIGDFQPNFFMSFYYSPNNNVTSNIWAENNVIHKTWTTPAGRLRASINYDDKWPHGFDIPFFSDFNIGHFVEPWLQTHQDLECLQHILRPIQTKDELQRVRFECAEVKAFADNLQIATIAHIGTGLTGAQMLFGTENLCTLVIDQPELVAAYLELEHKMNIRHMEIACENGVDIVRRNGFYETCDFYSPDMLEKFLGGLLREEIETVHTAGKLFAYTINTGIMPMLDYLSTLDFDCLLHLDPAFEGVDLAKVNDKLADKKSFWTGPSGTYNMWSDDTEIPRKALREVCQAFGRTGLIITPSPSAHSIMPWQNTLAMIDEWKKLR